MSDQRRQTTFHLLSLNTAVVMAPLYATDKQVAELVLGERASLWRPELVRQLEREGLPQPRHLLGSMRYVPAVFNFFAKREGLRHTVDDGPENFDP